jgi:hypothetical protein
MVLLYNRLSFTSYNELIYKITDVTTKKSMYSYKSFFNEPVYLYLHESNRFHHYLVMNINGKISKIELRDLTLNKTITTYEDLDKLCSEHRIYHQEFAGMSTFKKIPSSVQSLMHDINQDLTSKCKDLSLSFNYGFKLTSTIHHYRENLTPLYLCLSYQDKCISFIICDIENDTLTIEIKTSSTHQNKKYNLLLNSIILIIAHKYKIKNIYAYAINPITVFMLVRHFDTIYNANFDKFINDRPITLEICNQYFNQYHFLEMYVPITIQNVKKAIHLYQSLLESTSHLKCP